MTLRKFLRRLNWRQVAIHFIATWFFMYSFQTLAALHNTDLIDIVRQSSQEDITKALSESTTSAYQLVYFNLWTGIGNTVGLLVAFIISLSLSIRRKWFWFNSFIVLLVAYVLSWFGLLGWTYLKIIFLTPGEIFSNTTLQFLTNGILLLSLGLLTFFMSQSNKFITAGNRATT